MLTDDYEEFTPAQVKILERYVSNTSSHVFVLRNLPEVIMGALFSRYSRSNLGLRSLLLKEFINNNEEAGFANIVGSEQTNLRSEEDQALAIKKAQSFYDRILDGYGDDSIAELGGAHLAIENVSMLTANMIEHSRIGGSPLEKSTRYIYFDQKVDGDYLYYREPILMTSAWKDLYLQTCDMLFDTYSRLIPPLTAQFEAVFPHTPDISKAAYTAALRAKVLDCLRGLLPSSALTNMGIYGNGRFFDGLIHKMHCSNLTEVQETGQRIYTELEKVIPSFIRRAGLTHRTHQSYEQFCESMKQDLQVVTREYASTPERSLDPGVRLISSDPEAVIKVAAGLLFENSNKGLFELTQMCRTLSDEDIARILDAGCGARENRRHKSPRALEQAFVTFEIIGDFGAFRDLHRHRMLTQERQLLSCDYGYCVPAEIIGTELEAAYHEAMQKAKSAYDTISAELPEEAQYIVPMGFNVRWYVHVNLRALQWLCELRSGAAGHPNYRYIAQAMAQQVIERYPEFERYFKFVDYEGYDMGRMGQEQRRVEKQKV